MQIKIGFSWNPVELCKIFSYARNFDCLEIHEIFIHFPPPFVFPRRGLEKYSNELLSKSPFYEKVVGAAENLSVKKNKHHKQQRLSHYFFKKKSQGRSLSLARENLNS